MAIVVRVDADAERRRCCPRARPVPLVGAVGPIAEGVEGADNPSRGDARVVRVARVPGLGLASGVVVGAVHGPLAARVGNLATDIAVGRQDVELRRPGQDRVAGSAASAAETCWIRGPAALSVARSRIATRAGTHPPPSIRLTAALKTA